MSITKDLLKDAETSRNIASSIRNTESNYQRYATDYSWILSEFGYTPDSLASSFSPDNPYYLSLQYAKNVDDFHQLRNEAINWESKKEQRFYESPLAQVSRMRAAGLNPDLDGGSSVSTGSSSANVGNLGAPVSTAQQDRALDLQEQQLKQQAILGGFGAAASLLGGIGSVAQIGLNMSERIADWGANRLSARSAASLADSSATLAAKTLPNTVAKSNISAVRDGIGLVGDVASQLSSEQVSDRDYVVKHLTGLGVSDPEALADRVVAYGASPQMQKYYNDNIVAARKSQAEQEIATFDSIRQLTSDAYAIQMYQGSQQRSMAQFNAALADLLNTPENLENTSAAVLDSNAAAASESHLRKQKAEFAVNRWFFQLEQLTNQITDSFNRVQKYQSLYDESPSPTNAAKLQSALVAHARLEGLAAEELSMMYDLLDKTSSHDYIFETTSGDSPYIGNGNFKGRFLDFNNFVFDNVYDASNGTFKLDGVLSAVMGAALALVTKRASAPAASSLPNNGFFSTQTVPIP